MVSQSACRARSGRTGVNIGVRSLLYAMGWVCLVLVTACTTTGGHSSRDDGVRPEPFRVSVAIPEGAGPHPLVIDMHGCGGVWAQRQRHWIGHLRTAGFAVMTVDSFSGRGFDNVCDRVFAVSPYTRTFDAAAAIALAKEDVRFNPQAIFLMGSSHGASSALLLHLYDSPIFSQLRGVIAYYPYCPERLPVLNADLLLVIGSADDWTPAHLCRDMKIINRAGHSYDLVVYPDAHHSFDIPGVNSVYHGHRVLYNRTAAEDSMRRTLDFLRRRADS